jgi:hypothetical protein
MTAFFYSYIVIEVIWESGPLTRDYIAKPVFQCDLDSGLTYPQRNIRWSDICSCHLLKRELMFSISSQSIYALQLGVVALVAGIKQSGRNIFTSRLLRMKKILSYVSHYLGF